MNSEQLDHSNEGNKRQLTGVLLSAGVAISLVLGSFLSDGQDAFSENPGEANSGPEQWQNPLSVDSTNSIVGPEEPVSISKPTPVIFGRGYMGPYGVNAKE